MSNIGFIYKMWSKTDPSLVYYGSTTQKHVCSRITGHRTNYNQWKKGNYHFVTSFRIIETGDWDYMTLEKIIFDDPFELKNRERFYIENNDCVNHNIPNQTKVEYDKQYYIENKDEITEYQAQYRDTHKENKREYDKQYRIDNKKNITANASEIVQCECGCCVRADGLSKHRNSKKHKTIMLNLRNIILIP